eukprot:scaffold14384_cov48-Attheya_sp.AAC.1
MVKQGKGSATIAKAKTKPKEGATETTSLLRDDTVSGPKVDVLVPEESKEEPERSKIHYVFVLISLLAVVASFCVIISQLIVARKGTFLQYLLRVYMMLFCTGFILTELEVDIFLKWMPAFGNWVFRGFIYSFIGVVCAEEAYSVQVSDIATHTNVFSGTVKAIFLMIVRDKQRENFKMMQLLAANKQNTNVTGIQV